MIGAIVLSRAANEISAKVAASPKLAAALQTFKRVPAKADAAERPAVEGAVHSVSSGPLGANGVPATLKLPDSQVVPFNPLKDIAFPSSTPTRSAPGCAGSALVAAVIAAVILGGRTHSEGFADQG